MVLAIVSLQSSIYMPFRAPKSLLTQSEQLIAQQRALAEQQDRVSANKDTDGDGISDLDETNVFHTSPYLTDTDSDGISDGDEVRLGSDPSCPKDQECYNAVGENPDAIPLGEVVASSTPATRDIPKIETPLPPETLSSEQIRSYLVRNHLATEEQVRALPDAAVIELYRRAYADLLGAQATPTSGSADGTPSITATSTSSPS